MQQRVSVSIREDITPSSIILATHVECRQWPDVCAYNASDVPVRPVVECDAKQFDMCCHVPLAGGIFFCAGSSLTKQNTASVLFV